MAEVLERDFGSVENFKQTFTEAALKHDGEGWAWLVYRPDGKLVVTTTWNDDNPLMKEFVPEEDYGRAILCLDVWGHAYSPKYVNDRAAYIAAWWKVVNWSFMSRAYDIVTSGLV